MLRATPAIRLLLVAAAGSAVASCTTRFVPPVARIDVRHSWARMADSGTTSGAYLDIHNNDSVAITLVAVTTSDADAADVHETMQQEGMVHMLPRTEVHIPAGGLVQLAPGGVHVMLSHLRRSLTVGDSVHLRLRFRDGTSVAVTAPVQTP